VQPFALDPEIKQEYLYLRPTRRPSTTVVDRAGAAATLINQNGERQQLVASIDPAESLLAQVTDPSAYPELNLVRRSLLDWRFYHHFDTAPTALARHSQPGVRVNALAPDGRDLAAALTTLAERGDVGPVEAAGPPSTPRCGSPPMIDGLRPSSAPTRSRSISK
jgi:predicted ATPase